MKRRLALLTVLLLVPLAALHAAEVTGGRNDSAPFVGGKEGYAVYRCPTLAVSAKGTALAFPRATPAFTRTDSAAPRQPLPVSLRLSCHATPSMCGPLPVAEQHTPTSHVLITVLVDHDN